MGDKTPTDCVPAPGALLSLLGALFLAFLLGTGFWFMWALVAPRDFHGQGMIPDGCGPLQDVRESVFGVGATPMCWKPGVARTGLRP